MKRFKNTNKLPYSSTTKFTKVKWAKGVKMDRWVEIIVIKINQTIWFGTRTRVRVYWTYVILHWALHLTSSKGIMWFNLIKRDFKHISFENIYYIWLYPDLLRPAAPPGSCSPWSWRRGRRRCPSRRRWPGGWWAWTGGSGSRSRCPCCPSRRWGSSAPCRWSGRSSSPCDPGWCWGRSPGPRGTACCTRRSLTAPSLWATGTTHNVLNNIKLSLRSLLTRKYIDYTIYNTVSASRV